MARVIKSFPGILHPYLTWKYVAVGDLATQGTTISAVMILIYFSQEIPISAPQRLIYSPCVRKCHATELTRTWHKIGPRGTPCNHGCFLPFSLASHHGFGRISFGSAVLVLFEYLCLRGVYHRWYLDAGIFGWIQMVRKLWRGHLVRSRCEYHVISWSLEATRLILWTWQSRQQQCFRDTCQFVNNRKISNSNLTA